jgi:hypothetical protein
MASLNSLNNDMPDDYSFGLPSQEKFDFFEDFGVGLDLNYFQLPGLDNFDEGRSQFSFSPEWSEPPSRGPEPVALNLEPQYSTPQDIPSASPTGASFQVDHQSPAKQDRESAISGNASNPPSLTAVKPREMDNVIEHNKTAKRKWQESVSVFSMNGGKKVVPQRRNAYTPSRRTEVALNRLLGACVQCKIHRGPVSSSGIKIDS